MLSDEIKSVYVRNLLPSVSPSEIEEEFKNFGRIRPDGVVIRSRKVYVFASSTYYIKLGSFMSTTMLNFTIISRMLAFVTHLLNLKI